VVKARNARLSRSRTAQALTTAKNNHLGIAGRQCGEQRNGEGEYHRDPTIEQVCGQITE